MFRRIHVAIKSYNRPVHLSLLLKDLERESKLYPEVSVAVHDDCSSEEMCGLRLICKDNGWTWNQSRSRYGKQTAWAFTNVIFDTLKHQRGKPLFVMLDDDMRLCRSFFNRAVEYWDIATVCDGISMHLMIDSSRQSSPCWTKKLPVQLNKSMRQIQWVDGSYVCDRRMLDALGWMVDPIDRSRWESDPSLSTGVGQQISKRLHYEGCRMLQVGQSLVVHSGFSSNYNPGERQVNPLRTVQFIDGDKARDALENEVERCLVQGGDDEEILANELSRARSRRASRPAKQVCYDAPDPEVLREKARLRIKARAEAEARIQARALKRKQEKAAEAAAAEVASKERARLRAETKEKEKAEALERRKARARARSQSLGESSEEIGKGDKSLVISSSQKKQKFTPIKDSNRIAAIKDRALKRRLHEKQGRRPPVRHKSVRQPAGQDVKNVTKEEIKALSKAARARDSIPERLSFEIRSKALGPDSPVVYASLASIPSRASILSEVVKSLIDQVDCLHVYLNGYKVMPPCLKHDKIAVTSSFHRGDRGDAGKVFWSDRIEGYHFLCDDDIRYPDDYISRLTNSIEGYGRKAVVGVHGVVLSDKPKLASYYRGRTVTHFTGQLRRDKPVHLLGTGCLAYHTSTVSVKPEAFEVPNMADIWMGLLCQQQEVPMICVSRGPNWLKPIRTPTTIYSASVGNDRKQTDIVRRIWPWTMNNVR